MGVDVTATTAIERPLDEVVEFAGDPANAPTWYRRIRSATWVTDPPMRLGSRIEFRAHFLGRELRYVYEVVELTAGEQLAMRTVDGPFPMHTTYTWRPLSDRASFMAIRNHGEPAGVARLFAPLVAGAMRRAMRQDLAELKRILEAA